MADLMATYIENRELVNPNHGNAYGIAHGGHVVRWMDEVGAMSAMRHAGRTCVTARMDQVNFRRPIPVGEVALIESYVYAVGETSLRVHVRAAREDPLTGETEPTTESYFVYVALDDDRQPTPVPELEVTTDRGAALRDEAREGDESADRPG